VAQDDGQRRAWIVAAPHVQVEPHTPAASTCTSACPGSNAGMATCSMDSGALKARRMAAVAGMAYSSITCGNLDDKRAL
jgi:hypothetical protein